MNGFLTIINWGKNKGDFAIILIVSLIILFIYFLYYLGGEDYSKSSKISIYVFIDCTELEENNHNSTTIKENMEKIINQFYLNNKHNYGIVKLIPLYDFVSSKSITAKLDKGKGRNENQNNRNNDLKKFKDNIDEYIDEILNKCKTCSPQSYTKSDSNYAVSVIFRNICNHIPDLDKDSTTTNKIIILFSDLLENNNEFNFYKSCSKASDKYYKNVFAQFDDICKLNFSDKKVFVIHTIFNDGNIEKFKKKEKYIEFSKKLWEKYFKNNGIKKGDFSFTTEFPEIISE